MKKCLAATFICAYLGILTFGFVAHTFGAGVSSHPGMYFIVWDMFCGWTAHSSATEVLAEGESGDFYRLSPAPWGDFVPFSTRPRLDYDVKNVAGAKFGANVLRHTAHEEMLRILVVEKAWPKKFNLPDKIWNQAYAEPKDVHYYYRLRAVADPDGTITGANNAWLDAQVARIMTENPRLRNDSRKGNSPYVLDQPTVANGGNSPTVPFQLSPNAQ